MYLQNVEKFIILVFQNKLSLTVHLSFYNQQVKFVFKGSEHQHVQAFLTIFRLEKIVLQLQFACREKSRVKIDEPFEVCSLIFV